MRVQEKVQLFSPNEEDSYFTLMKLYHVLKNASAVREQYWLLKKMLQEQLAEEPNKEIVKWYDNWEREYKQTQIDVLG